MNWIGIVIIPTPESCPEVWDNTCEVLRTSPGALCQINTSFHRCSLGTGLWGRPRGRQQGEGPVHTWQAVSPSSVAAAAKENPLKPRRCPPLGSYAPGTVAFPDPRLRTGADLVQGGWWAWALAGGVKVQKPEEAWRPYRTSELRTLQRGVWGRKRREGPASCQGLKARLRTWTLSWNRHKTCAREQSL